MQTTESQQREAVVKEALSWLRTPYHHNARVKGAGVDCAMLLAEVYPRAGVVPPVDSRYYPRDWHLHRDEERYLSEVLKHGREFEGPPLPGDVVLFRFGRCFSHGAIVIDWPVVLHAYVGKGVELADVEKEQWLKFIGEGDNSPRPRRYFTLWPATPADVPPEKHPPQNAPNGAGEAS